MYLEVFKKIIDSSLVWVSWKFPLLKGLALIAACKFIYHPLFFMTW